jgi:heme/copper-type cytochrome/quinol oxidase subunit 1
MCVNFGATDTQMRSVGKLFAVAAILALVVGFVRWPLPQNGFYTITIKNRAYGLGSDYWAFPIGAVFAALAVAYYWLPLMLSLRLGEFVSHLHFWLSAVSAFAFLLLLPVWNAFPSLRRSFVSDERGSIAILVIAGVSTLLFLLAQIIFATACLWNAFSSTNS